MQDKGAIRILKLVLLVLGLVLAIAISTVAGPCVHDDGTVGVCYPAGQALIFLGVAVAALSIIGMFAKGPQVATALFALTAIAGLAAAVLPGTAIPLCSMAAMRCNTVMHPTGIVLGILVAIVSAAGLALSIRRISRAGKAR